MLSDFINDFSEFRMALWDNLPSVIVALIVFLLLLLLRGNLSRGIGSALQKSTAKWPVLSDGLYHAVVRPLRLFFIFFAIWLLFEIIQPTAGHVVFRQAIMDFVDKLYRLACIFSVGWALALFAPYLTQQMLSPETGMQKSSEVAVRFLSNVMKIIVVSIAVVIAISELGYNINGIITGLGLGGLTFSLAAQRTASNLFAGFEMVTDKPFDVGDYIKCKSCEGTIEDMNMRSTRVRTMDDLLVVVPNSVLMDEAVTNFTAMGKRYHTETLTLKYDTKPAAVRRICAEIQAMLECHPGVDDGRIVVRFDGFGESSLNLRVLYFTKTVNYDEALAVNEDVDFKIHDIVARNEAEFAYPSTSVYLENRGKNEV